MTTEDDFNAMLDANPEDHTTRLVFADWLQERGDARAEGIRALGVLAFFPYHDLSYGPWNDDRKDGECWVWWVGVVDPQHAPNNLSADWFAILDAPGHYISDSGNVQSKDYYTRAEAEDAAALAFAKLPAKRRAELLAGTCAIGGV